MHRDFFLSPLLFGVAAMSKVVLIPGGEPKPFKQTSSITDLQEFFRLSAQGEFTEANTKVLVSSLDGASLSAISGLQPSSDSFARGAIQAWGEHHHFVIRPEEVWFTILVQMNFYMSSHAEELRDMFVSHKGKEVIEIWALTWEEVLIRFQDEIQARVKTDWLQDWIMPNFTTSTPNDEMTANILMMGVTKAYFDYAGGIICGLPSVTLLGEKSDWEALYAKLDRLSDFGLEPTEYQNRLKPILARFVESFDKPTDPQILSFWRNIVIAEKTNFCGAPPFYISGWITGFWYWDDKGQPYGRNDFGLGSLDGVKYPRLDIRSLPVGYATVPFTMLDFNNTERYDAMLLAGTLGKRITEGYPDGYIKGYEEWMANDAGRAKPPEERRAAHSTLQPMSGWMLYGPVPHDRESPSPKNQELGMLPAYIKSNTCPTLISSRDIGMLPQDV
jgi:hypothetical protein